MADLQALMQRAADARRQAYSPYSGFAVGAAVQMKSGNIYTGCNVENGALSLSICAERVAMSCAISAGEQEFACIVIAAQPLAPPCGSCRQFMVEFGESIEVISFAASDMTEQKSWTTGQLLPDQFRLKP